MTYIGLYFYDLDTDDEIISVSANCQPFKIGDYVNLQKKNNDVEKWDVDNLEKTEYQIINIISHVSKYYGVSIIEHMNFSISVKKVDSSDKISTSDSLDRVE